jgi:hypothetical protein
MAIVSPLMLKDKKLAPDSCSLFVCVMQASQMRLFLLTHLSAMTTMMTCFHSAGDATAMTLFLKTMIASML